MIFLLEQKIKDRVFPSGRRFDKNGNIIGEWWQASALKEFDKRAHCIEQQYSKYKIQHKYPVSFNIFETAQNWCNRMETIV